MTAQALAALIILFIVFILLVVTFIKAHKAGKKQAIAYVNWLNNLKVGDFCYVEARIPLKITKIIEVDGVVEYEMKMSRRVKKGNWIRQFSAEDMKELAKADAANQERYDNAKEIKQ